MQTDSGEDAQGFCKEEFQSFLKWFVVPLCSDAVERRLQLEEAMQHVPQYECCDGSMRTLQQIVHDLHQTFTDAYAALEAGLWQPWNGHKRQGSKGKVPKHAYKPLPPHNRPQDEDFIPYFISMDNGPGHSFWVGKKKRDGVHLNHIGCSLMQILYMAPHGHDMHQIVEHSIGVVKRKARKALREHYQKGDLTSHLGCILMYEAVMGVSASLTGESISNGLPRMWNALLQIAAPKGVFIDVVTRSGKTLRLEGTGGGYATLA